MSSDIKPLGPASPTSPKHSPDVKSAPSEGAKLSADDSVIADTKPAIDDPRVAELLSKTISADPRLDSAHGQLDEDRVKSLLADD